MIMVENKIYTDWQLAKLFGITSGRIMMSDDEDFVFPLKEHEEHEQGELSGQANATTVQKALKTIAAPNQKSLEKTADAIEQMVLAGRISRKEVGQLIDFGLDQESVDAWEAKYGGVKPSSGSPYRNGAEASGMTCKFCGEFYPYADKANQVDGSFKCFGCRH